MATTTRLWGTARWVCVCVCVCVISPSYATLNVQLPNILLVYVKHIVIFWLVVINKVLTQISIFFVFQGMNFIAGYLIIVTKDEEKSFWLMDALLGRILPGQS